MRRVALLVVVIATVGAVAAAAYFGSRSGNNTAASATPGIPVGTAAPSFSLAGLREKVTSQSFRGRALVVAFITPTCRTCAADVRRLGSLAPNLIGPAGARTYYVVVDRGRPSANRIARFATSAGVPVGLMFASDPTGETWHAFGVASPGTIFVIGPNGRVTWRGIDPALSLLNSQVDRVGSLVILPSGTRLDPAPSRLLVRSQALAYTGRRPLPLS